MSKIIGNCQSTIVNQGNGRVKALHVEPGALSLRRVERAKGAGEKGGR